MQFPTIRAPIPNIIEMTDGIQKPEDPYIAVLGVTNNFYSILITKVSQPQFAFRFQDT